MPESILPVTLSELRVPTEVIFGCAAVVTVPAVVAAPDKVPTNVVAVSAPFAIFAVYTEFASAATLPVVALPNRTYITPVVASVVFSKYATLALPT